MRRHFLSLFLSIFFLTSFCQAQDFSMTLDQSKVRLIIPPGGSKAGIIKARSFSKKSIRVKVYAEDWLYDKTQDGSKSFFPEKTTPLSCAEWVKFSPAELIIGPLGTGTVNYVVRLPEDAVGGHYCVIFFESQVIESPVEQKGAPSNELRVGTELHVRLGSLFYIEAKGKIDRKVDLGNFSASINTDKNLELKFDFKNTGNTDITADTTFDIMDKKGNVYARGKFNTVYTLPGDSAVLSSVWKEPLKKGNYDCVITSDLGKALMEAGIGRGPVVVKEAELLIGDNGEIIKAGELK